MTHVDTRHVIGFMVVDAMRSFTMDTSDMKFVTNSMEEEEVCAPETRTRSSVEK